MPGYCLGSLFVPFDYDEKMDDLRLYFLFNSFIVMLGQLEGVNERLFAMETGL